MPFNTILGPAELCTVAKALNEFCEENRIDDSEGLVRKAIARRTMYLFMSGIRSHEGLKDALNFDRGM
jgi:hypothetical protein